MDTSGRHYSYIEQIAEQIPGGFLIHRAEGEGEILYINHAVLDIFGCDSEEEFRDITGYTFRGLVHPLDLDAVHSSISRQIDESSNKMDQVEYRIIRRDGQIRWISGYGHFVHTEDQGDLYYVFLYDITEKHTALEESRRETEVIEGLSHDFTSIFLIDTDAGMMRPYRLNSEMAREIVGRSQTAGRRSVSMESMFSEYAERYIVEEDRDRFMTEIDGRRIRQRLMMEDVYTTSYRIENRESGLRHMEMTIVRIDSAELYHHAVMSFRDVTEGVLRVQAQTMEKLRIEEDLSRQRRNNEAKNNFLFNISHDIRTPMNSIMGFTQLAKRHIDDPALLAEYLDKVDVSNRHMLSLIDDLLEMSQIDTGQIRLHVDEEDITGQLHQVVEMMRTQAADKAITITEENTIPADPVFLDALRFRRVIANILSNAIKFTPAGGCIRVSSYLKKVSKPGYVRCVIEIEDNGIGMSPEFLNRMYEAFEREETSTQTGYIGTGLGLAITKRLLDIMGGSIEASSEKGKGSTFTVSIPLRLARTEGGANIRADRREQSIYTRERDRILLVEDIEINRILAETILKEAGFLVDSVDDGCDAVEAVREAPEDYYDLILMDIQMPVMNGYEATRVIRSMGRPDTDQIPIIALSANAREEDKTMSMESGMNSHIAKPFDVEKMLASVRKHIAQYRSPGKVS